MPFRLEYALSGRAGCKATECKKQGIKIDKGELRHGTFLEIQDHQSWAWKHWGCVTPVQIANLKKDIEGNLEYLDGYEELNDDDKAKVRQAIGDGHVADEDWRYDVEMNRPGKKGFRSPAYKAQHKAEKKAAEDQEPSATPSKPLPKKRSRTIKEEDSENEKEAEVPIKKKRARVKKENNDDANVGDVAAVAPTKSRVRVKKELLREIVPGVEGEKKPKKLQALPMKVKNEDTESSDVSGRDMSVLEEKKPRAKKAAAKLKRQVSSTEEDVPDLEVPGKATSRSKATASGKKSVPKVKLEVINNAGVEDDFQDATEAAQEMEAKVRSKKKSNIKDPISAVKATANASARITRSRTK